MLNYKEIGRKIYNLENPKEYHRYVVFRIRAALHPQKMRRLERFFTSTPQLTELADIYGFVYEQPTRAFFYNKSTFDERARLVEEHFTYLTEHLDSATVLALYRGEMRELWRSTDEGEPMRIVLWYHPGQRKEGLMTVSLFLGEEALYQMMFWIARDKQGEWALYIGAMQGPNMADARDVIKRVTKRCHAYRTKNLILHATQETAKALGLAHIYGVTNYGYYANNHVRRDRKLKTSFSDFWEESGGTPLTDKRFYELPMTEERKDMEEIPSKKRAYYRRRYALLDEIDAAIAASVRALYL